MHKLFLFIKSLLIPFKVDAILPNILIFIPRVFAGYLLSFVYAINKFGTPWTPKALGLQLFQVSEWFIEIVKQFGLPFSLMPQVFAWSAGFIEALGGILLILGLNTRITSFFILVTMFITIAFRPWDDTWSIVPTFFFFCISLFFMGFGSGKFGLDYFITKRM